MKGCIVSPQTAISLEKSSQMCNLCCSIINVDILVLLDIYISFISDVGPENKNVFLFNTEQDPSETTDVFEDYPEVSFNFCFCYYCINFITYIAKSHFLSMINLPNGIYVCLSF